MRTIRKPFFTINYFYDIMFSLLEPVGNVLIQNAKRFNVSIYDQQFKVKNNDQLFEFSDQVVEEMAKLSKKYIDKRKHNIIIIRNFNTISIF